MILQYLEQK